MQIAPAIAYNLIQVRRIRACLMSRIRLKDVVQTTNLNVREQEKAKLNSKMQPRRESSAAHRGYRRPIYIQVRGIECMDQNSIVRENRRCCCIANLRQLKAHWRT